MYYVHVHHNSKQNEQVTNDNYYNNNDSLADKETVEYCTNCFHKRFIHLHHTSTMY